MTAVPDSAAQATRSRAEPEFVRYLRYLAPNIITLGSICFGLMSLASAHAGEFAMAGWWIIWCSFTDRLDGLVARTLRSTSELGVQLDSLADMLNFGLAPAFLVYTAMSQAGVGFDDGSGLLVLRLCCAGWVLGACYRLGRYNISTGETATPRIFFGVPTTLAAGVLVIWFICLLKYSAPGNPIPYEFEFRGPRLFGAGVLGPQAWSFFPYAMLAGGMLMASNLRMPKLGLAKSRAATVFVLTNVALGILCGIARYLPDYMVWPPTMWLVVFLVWGQLSKTARAMRPPPALPEKDPPRGQEPLRPEDDMLDDHELGDDDLVF